jgi:hypothetical protein
VDPTDPETEMIAYSAIMINTKSPKRIMTIKDYGQVVVHELGHWFSHVFGYFENLEMDIPVCGGIHIHFKHPPGECVGGDWRLYSNLMKDGGGWFISRDQAEAFNSYSDQVIP